jgi:hypothetical protein
MDQVKQLTNSIDTATSDMLTAPTVELYVNVEKLLSTRADMYFRNIIQVKTSCYALLQTIDDQEPQSALSCYGYVGISLLSDRAIILQSDCH